MGHKVRSHITGKKTQFRAKFRSRATPESMSPKQREKWAVLYWRGVSDRSERESKSVEEFNKRRVKEVKANRHFMGTSFGRWIMMHLGGWDEEQGSDS